ncbi:MAG: exo-alpha-sialidase [Anaerolineae bacterium]|nr:exo-alpha-sialidase [Anaerolineae bacterium]
MVNAHPVTPLADDYVTVCESPDPDRIFCYSPGLARLPGGRLVATTDWGGPGVVDLVGETAEIPEAQRFWQGRIYTSDDRGRTWDFRATFPFMHARPLVAGGALYVLGHARDLTIIRSDDQGETWSLPSRLTHGQIWHQAPCNVHYANGCVYLVMERRVSQQIQTWYVGELAPVLMRAPVAADLRAPSAWTFASELKFRDVIPGVESNPAIDYFGVPFWNCPYPAGSNVAPGRNCAPIGWLETNVVQFTHPDHLWYDATGKTLHLWMRAHTGGTGYACVAKVVEQGDVPGTGRMTTMLETAPSGKHILYVPCPGGQMKFHVLYDAVTRLFWLLSTQAVDSMMRPERLTPDRFNLPNNERQRLQLHFSKNMIDWCFGGLVATGPAEHASRHYASMAIAGDDLQILSRSGDVRAHSAHDGNLITFHTVRDFRRLVY